MSFANNLKKVLKGNIIFFISGLITGLIIPYYLSLNEYATFRTFSLIATFAAIFHLGIPDGVYILLGGIKKSQLDNIKISNFFSFFIIFQIIISIVVLFIGYITNESYLIVLSIFIVFANTTTFFLKYFIATSQFNNYYYLRTFSAYSVICAYTIGLLFSRSAFVLIILNIFFLGIVAIYTFSKEKIFFDIKSIFRLENYNLIKIGIFIMLGNTGSLLFFSFDRWVVNVLFSREEFAYYAFAVSILTIINLGISSIGLTLYPKLLEEKNNNIINELKVYLLILGAFSMQSFYFVSIVIEIFFIKYIPAIQIILLLFASFPATFMISILFENLYKSKKLERKYFKVVSSMLLLILICNIIGYFLLKNVLIVSGITVFVSYIWIYYSSKDFSKDIQLYKKDYIYIFLVVLTFISISSNFEQINGFIINIILLMLITILLFKQEFRSLLLLAKNMIDFF